MPTGQLVRPMNGCSVCGDQCGIVIGETQATPELLMNDPTLKDRVVIWMIDGLGHGQLAYQSASLASRVVRGLWNESIGHILKECDRALAQLRGAAIGIAMIDVQLQEIQFAGIGNIRAMQVGRHSRRYSSTPGIVGAQAPEPIMEKDEFGEMDTLIMFTDGLKEVIDISAYRVDADSSFPDLCDELINDWGSDDDDCGVIIYAR